MPRCSSIIVIARKEFRQYLQDRRLYWAGGLIFLLFALASFMGRELYLQETVAEQAFSSEERERWLNQPEETPHTAAHHGVYLFQPKPPASAVEPGISKWSGSVVFLEAHSRNFFRFPAARDQGQGRRLGELSVAALLEIVLPLLVVLLAYDAFAGERESGTLRLTLAQGVTPGELTMGKFLGLLAALAAMLAPGLVCTVVVLWGVVPWDTAISFAATYGLYLLQIASIVLMISMMARTSRTALLGSLVFWLWNCAIVPQAAVTVVSHLWPVPDPLEVRASIIEEQSKHPTLWDRRDEINRRYLTQYGVSSLFDLPVNPDGILLLEQEEYDTQATGGNVKRVYDAYRQQDRMYRWAALAAPSVGTQTLSRAVAGTDLDQFQDFADAAEEYRQRMVRLMNETTAYDRSIRTGTIHSRAAVLNVAAGADLWEKLPPFQYQPGDLGMRLRRSAWMMAASLAWLCASGAGLIFAMQNLRRPAV